MMRTKYSILVVLLVVRQNIVSAKLTGQCPPENRNCEIQCGIKGPEPKNNYRVVGGTETLPGEWPWHVSIGKGQKTKNKPFESFCGGILLDRETVLTKDRNKDQPN